MGDSAVIRALEGASPKERGAARLLLLGAQSKEEMDAVKTLLTAGRERKQQRASDGKRRLLVGPRLPRETAERYREAAAAKGQSLYQWAADALEAYYKGGGASAPPPALRAAPPGSPVGRPPLRSGQQNQSCCLPASRGTAGRRSRGPIVRRRAARPGRSGAPKQNLDFVYRPPGASPVPVAGSGVLPSAGCVGRRVSRR